MRTWEHARIAERCGCCNRSIKATEPMLVLTFAHLKGAAKRRLRCRECAGEAPDQAQLDADDAAQERAAIASDGGAQAYVFSGVTNLLPFDGKAAAARSDE